MAWIYWQCSNCKREYKVSEELDKTFIRKGVRYPLCNRCKKEMANSELQAFTYDWGTFNPYDKHVRFRKLCGSNGYRGRIESYLNDPRYSNTEALVSYYNYFPEDYVDYPQQELLTIASENDGNP